MRVWKHHCGALVCGFQHGLPPFSDCSLCFTHIMGTLSRGSAVTVLYRFLLVLSVSWGHWYHGICHSLPSFYHGKTAPGGGCSSRGSHHLSSLLKRKMASLDLYKTTVHSIIGQYAIRIHYL